MTPISDDDVIGACCFPFFIPGKRTNRVYRRFDNSCSLSGTFSLLAHQSVSIDVLVTIRKGCNLNSVPHSSSAAVTDKLRLISNNFHKWQLLYKWDYILSNIPQIFRSQFITTLNKVKLVRNIYRIIKKNKIFNLWATMKNLFITTAFLTRF